MGEKAPVCLERLGTIFSLLDRMASCWWVCRKGDHLVERAVHVHPGTKPQAHNVLGIPLAGAALQDEGLLVCLNEVAVGVSLSTVFGALLLDFEKDRKKRIIDSAVGLAEAIGRATITEIDDYYREVLADPSSRDRAGQIASTLRRLQNDARQ
jgi:hypothetical protein